MTGHRMGRIAFKGLWFDVEAYSPRLPTGKSIYFERVVRSDGVMVVPLLGKGRVILLKEYRPAVRSWLHTFPGGGIGKKESQAAAARKELAEETGYIAKEIKKIGSFYVDPGFITTKVHVFIARGLYKGKKHLDDRELTKVVIASTKNLESRLMGSRTHDSRSLAALAVLRATDY